MPPVSHVCVCCVSLQVELRRLEDAVAEVYEEMLYMRTREEEMRNTNGEGCCCACHCFDTRADPSRVARTCVCVG